MIGRLIDQYEVIEKLGEGGMGAVYKAVDRRLERFVAIKILAPRLEENASPNDTARLDKEARAVSALSHPHIATIHDRGEHEGQPYLVFEYLAGGTLREKLQAAGGRLPIRDVLRYAVEAADALSHAHRRGVVHRDIKTDNMMLTDEGSLKITDFGLALRNAGRDTGDVQAQGTAAYMSPEQGRGVDVDQRSDIFSFGISLFELSTGRVPFEGPHPAAVAYDIIHTPTPAMGPLREDLPAELERIVLKATAKDPDKRYLSSAELLEDLQNLQQRYLTGALPSAADLRRSDRRAWRVGAAAVAALALVGVAGGWMSQRGARPTADNPLTIAVLPFENLSRDASQDYLGEGVTESLMTDLARLPALRVVSRNSVRRFAYSGLSLREIASELGADRIVEGSVLRVGDRLRISAQLVDARADRHLWAESFEYSAEDVLKLQQEVARAVAAEVRQRLEPADGLRRRRVREVDPEAYAAYVRGRLAAFEWTPAGAQRSVQEFKHALEIDSAYAEAHAGLAIAYGFMSLNGVGLPRELWPRARAEAERALALDADLDQAHTALGFVEAVYDWNWGGAERSFRRALELNSGSVDARHALAMTVLAPQGRIEEALDAIRAARRLDPLSPALSSNVADVLAFAGRYEDALEEYGRAIELQPEFEEAWLWRGFIQLKLGRPQEARDSWRRVLEIQAGRVPAAEGLVHLADGDNARALELFEQARQSSPDPTEGYAPWCFYAIGFSLLGRPETAIEALENAYVQRSSHLVMLKVSPNFEALRGRERFGVLLRGMNLAD